MKRIVFAVFVLFLSISASAAGTQNRFRCFELRVFDICIPSISKGKNIVARTARSFDAKAVAEELSALTGKIVAHKSVTLITEPNDTEKLMLSDDSGTVLYRINSSLGNFMGSVFNKSAGFDGPNCYNTAFVATGILNIKQVRHVAKNELKLYLDSFFEKITGTPSFGDIVLYDSGYSNNHTAVYLFNDLIFQKKGFPRGYIYRITNLFDAFKDEPFEWKPSPFSDFHFPNHSFESEIRRRAYYRKLDRFPETTPPDETEIPRIAIINKIASAVLRNSPSWNAGKKLGITIERLASDLHREFSDMKKSRSLASRLALAKLESLEQQIFISIKNEHFSSPYARPDKINPEICVHFNDTFDFLVLDLLALYGKPASLLPLIREKVAEKDMKKCRINLLELIKSTS